MTSQRDTAIRDSRGKYTIKSALLILAVLVCAAGIAAGMVSATDPGASPSDTRETAAFELSIEEINSPTEGENLTVAVAVTNTDSEVDSTEVTLTVGGKVRDKARVSVAGESTETITLVWETESGDAGDYEAVVETPEKSASRSVTVSPESQPPSFTIQNVTTNSPVTAGDALTIDIFVKNDGDRGGNQTVELTVGGSVVDASVLQLDGGESASVRLTWETGPGDTGSYEASLATANDTARTDVRVHEPSSWNHDAAIQDVTYDPATDTIATTVLVTNTGNASGSGAVRLRGGPDDEVRDSTETGTLEPGASTTFELEWTNTGLDTGTYQIVVATANDTAETDVEVTEPAESANFVVTIEGTNAPVEDGESLVVSVRVENTGEAAGTQSITLGPDDDVKCYNCSPEVETVELGPGESTTFDLTWGQVESLESGADASFTVKSEDSKDSTVASIAIGGSSSGPGEGGLPLPGGSTVLAVVGIIGLVVAGVVSYGWYRSVRRRSTTVPVERSVRDAVAAEGSGELSMAGLTQAVETSMHRPPTFLYIPDKHILIDMGDSIRGSDTSGRVADAVREQDAVITGDDGSERVDTSKLDMATLTESVEASPPDIDDMVAWSDYVLILDTAGSIKHGPPDLSGDDLSMAGLTQTVEASARDLPYVIVDTDKYVLIFDETVDIDRTTERVADSLRDQGAVSTADDGSEVVDTTDLSMAALTQTVEDSAEPESGIIAWEDYVLRVPGAVPVDQPASHVNPDELTMDGLTDLVENSVDESRYTWYHPQHWVFVHDERAGAEQTTRNVVEKLEERGAIAGDEGDSSDVDFSGLSMAELTTAINESAPSETGILAWEDYVLVVSEVESDVSGWS